MAAACNEQGTIGITPWLPEGAFGGQPESMNDILGEQGINVGRWADPVAVQAFFGAWGTMEQDPAVRALRSASWCGDRRVS